MLIYTNLCSPCRPFGMHLSRADIALLSAALASSFSRNALRFRPASPGDVAFRRRFRPLSCTRCAVAAQAPTNYVVNHSEIGSCITLAACSIKQASTFPLMTAEAVSICSSFCFSASVAVLSQIFSNKFGRGSEGPPGPPGPPGPRVVSAGDCADTTAAHNIMQSTDFILELK